MARCSYGSGSLLTRRNAWYGRWWLHGRHVNRKIGPKRKPGTREGLTRKQAEIELRRVMPETRPAPRGEGVRFAAAASEYLRYVGDVRRIDPRTLADYRGVIDGYMLEEFGSLTLDAITPDAIDA